MLSGLPVLSNPTISHTEGNKKANREAKKSLDLTNTIELTYYGFKYDYFCRHEKPNKRLN